MTHIPFSRMESYWQYGVGVLLCISQIWCLIFIASTLVLLVFCLLFFRIQFSISKMDWTPQGPEYGVDSCLRFLVSAIEFCPQLWVHKFILVSTHFFASVQVIKWAPKHAVGLSTKVKRTRHLHESGKSDLGMRRCHHEIQLSCRIHVQRVSRVNESLAMLLLLDGLMWSNCLSYNPFHDHRGWWIWPGHRNNLNGVTLGTVDMYLPLLLRPCYSESVIDLLDFTATAKPTYLTGRDLGYRLSRIESNTKSTMFVKVRIEWRCWTTTKEDLILTRWLYATELSMWQIWSRSNGAWDDCKQSFNSFVNYTYKLLQ